MTRHLAHGPEVSCRCLDANSNHCHDSNHYLESNHCLDSNASCSIAWIHSMSNHLVTKKTNLAVDLDSSCGSNGRSLPSCCDCCGPRLTMLCSNWLRLICLVLIVPNLHGNAF